MENDILIQYVEQFGHLALFMVLCLGIVGLPIPNEVVAITGGILSATDVLNPITSFLMVFLGICSGATTGYCVSKYTAGRYLSKKVSDQNKLGEFMSKYEKINNQYGNYAVSLCVFLPGFRTLTPYIIGMKGMSYLKFAVYSYSAAFLWTVIYFSFGMFMFGDSMIVLGDY